MERTFWIQGRTGRYWQNLESLDSDQTAIVRLGTLISHDRYDELRLIQAQVSSITGETSYTNIVTVRDGQVIDSPMLRAQAASEDNWRDEAPDTTDAPDVSRFLGGQTTGDRSPDPHAEGQDTGLDDIGFDHELHPQLRFWPVTKQEHLQGRLGLGGENRWVGDAPDSPVKPSEPAQATPAQTSTLQGGPDLPRAPRMTAKFVPHVTVHSGPMEDEVLAGGWRIPKSLEGPETDDAAQRHPSGGEAVVGNPDAGAERNYDPRKASPIPTSLPGTAVPDAAPQKRASPGLSGDPESRVNSRKDAPERFRLPRFGKAARRSPRGTRSTPSAQSPNRPGRVALMSGVFAGALATGLALSAINPDFAGRFFAGISGQVGDFLPRTGLIDAIENGDLQLVRARLAEGVNPNTLDREGNPALLRAARAGNLAAVSLLLQAGADPTLPTQDGRSVLHRIAAEGRSQALQRMIDAGAPVDLAGGSYGCLTPLSVASANGRVRAASLLAERGAALEPQRGCSIGPMEIAAAHPHVLVRLEQLRAEREALLQMAAANQKALAAPRSGPSVVTAQPQGLDPNAPRDGDDIVSPFAGLQEPPPSLEANTDTFTAPQSDIHIAALPSPGTDTASAPGQNETVFLPPTKPTPPQAKPPQKSLTDPRVFTSRLKSAIDAGDNKTVVALLGSIPPGFSLDEAKYAVEDGFGSGVRTALEQAALRGEDEIVRLLSGDGATIPPRLIHRVVQHSDRAELSGMLSVLLEQGADPNGMSDGLTPLMRAALKGDPETAYMLMAFGADPNAVSTDGRLASDFAKEAGRGDLEERLVLAAGEPQYRKLMMGLSWSDTLSTLRDRIDVCKDIGDDFTACKLKVESWLDDAKVIVAQFDRKTSNRLVAIQIDSRPFTTAQSAMEQFEVARRAIQARVPQGHAGFQTTEVPSRDTLFQDLRPEVNKGRYFSYWPDQDRRRPVFVHLKLAGLDDKHGFYRVVIGNPFRAG